MIQGKTINCKLPNVARWERAKKGKVYPTGCTLLQVSATKGQLLYLHEPQTVDSKYCVIIPDSDKIEPFLLYFLLQEGMPEFLSREQTGLNIKPEILKRFPVCYYADRKNQKPIADQLYNYEIQAIHEEQIIEELKEMKKWLLNKMFPEEGKNIPALRFKGF